MEADVLSFSSIEEKERTYEQMKKRIEDKDHLIQTLLEKNH